MGIANVAVPQQRWMRRSARLRHGLGTPDCRFSCAEDAAAGCAPTTKWTNPKPERKAQANADDLTVHCAGRATMLRSRPRGRRSLQAMAKAAERRRSRPTARDAPMPWHRRVGLCGR